MQNEVESKQSTLKENLKVLPCPRPSDSTPIVPPLYSTIFLTIMRPSPMPGLLISAVRCNLPNLLKSLGKSYCAIPTPVSLICTMRRFSGAYL